MRSSISQLGIAALRLAALALVGLAALWPGTVSAAFPGENGKIAFERERAIWVMNPDGSAQTFLTCGGTTSPAWSPDGGKVAFTRNGDTSSEIWVMSADGSGQAPLGRGSSPAWSPDGQRIAFVVGYRGTFGDVWFEIWAMNADGSAPVRVSPEIWWTPPGPAWSPDGARIAFEDEGDIWTMNPEGSDRTRLYESASQASGPAWSPDGRRIAFARGPVGDIWTMDADGTGPVRLTNGRTQDAAPSWSPDGRRIAFERGGDIWTVGADGGHQVILTDSEARESAPDWQRLPSPPVHPPPRQFCFGEVRRNVNRGIARLAVRVPGPGRVVLQRRPGVRRFVQAYDGEEAGTVVLRVRPRGRARQRLNHRTNRLPVRAQVTFNPEGAEPLTKGRRVWLVQR